MHGDQIMLTEETVQILGLEIVRIFRRRRERDTTDDDALGSANTGVSGSKANANCRFVLGSLTPRKFEGVARFRSEIAMSWPNRETANLLPPTVTTFIISYPKLGSKSAAGSFSVRVACCTV